MKIDKHTNCPQNMYKVHLSPIIIDQEEYDDLIRIGTHAWFSDRAESKESLFIDAVTSIRELKTKRSRPAK